MDTAEAQPSKLQDCKKRISAHVEAKNNSTLQEPVVIPVAHGTESKFFCLASMWGFPTTKRVNNPRLLSYPTLYMISRWDCRVWKIFTRLDLTKGYYQIPVEDSDVPNTVITTTSGLFEFTQIPFGLRRASQSFQRLTDEVLKGLS